MWFRLRSIPHARGRTPHATNSKEILPGLGGQMGPAHLVFETQPQLGRLGEIKHIIEYVEILNVPK